MKTLHYSIIVLVGIIVIATTSIGVFIEKLDENPQHPYTSITIGGMKDNYTLNEPIVFSVIIEGYGTGCGDTSAIITNENNSQYQSPGWSSIVQCAAFAKPNYFKFNALSGNTTINQAGNYFLTVTFDHMIAYQHTTAAKKFSVIMPKTTIFDTGITPLSANVENTNFTINYNIEDGQVLGIKQDMQSRSIIVSIKTTGDGQLIVDLPRKLINSTSGYSNGDSPFIVLSDGQEIRATEHHKNIVDRTLSIPFQNGTGKIQIIGENPI